MLNCKTLKWNNIPSRSENFKPFIRRIERNWFTIYFSRKIQNWETDEWSCWLWHYLIYKTALLILKKKQWLWSKYQQDGSWRLWSAPWFDNRFIENVDTISVFQLHSFVLSWLYIIVLSKLLCSLNVAEIIF